MPEIHLRQPGFTYIAFIVLGLLIDHLLRIKKEHKSLNKLEIQDIFSKMN